jgi:hypothetical protein
MPYWSVCAIAMAGVSAMTILTALGNLVPSLPDEETYLALFHGLRRTARDCDRVPPRRDREPLATRGVRPVHMLGRWRRHWTQVRHRDGGARTLLTAIADGVSPGELAALLLTAVSDRTFVPMAVTLWTLSTRRSNASTSSVGRRRHWCCRPSSLS